MKRHFLILAVLLTLTSSAFSQYIVLTCDKPIEMYNDHVGHEWRFGFGINKTFYPAFEPVQAPFASASTIEFIAQEIDGHTDQTTISLDIDPAKLETNKQYSKKLEVIVTENGGRYKGKKAMFNITVYYKKVTTRV